MTTSRSRKLEVPQFQAPLEPPTTKRCRRLLIPNDINVIAAVNGVLSLLGRYEFWNPSFNVSQLDMVGLMNQMFLDYGVDGECNMVGQILHIATTTAPDNTLPCGGATYNRVDYPELYAVISSELVLDFDHFKTPDLTSLGITGTTYVIVAR